MIDAKILSYIHSIVTSDFPALLRVDSSYAQENGELRLR
jgi:hypothetical protein